MNEELAIATLEIIKKGESFSAETVLRELNQMPQYFDLTKKTFGDVWVHLHEIECLMPHDQRATMRGCVKLNPDKDCLSIYLGRREERLAAIKPQIQPKMVEQKITIATMIKSLLNLIFNNPLISGLIALIIGSLILKHYHII